MRFTKDFKRIAWEALQKDYWFAFLASLTVGILGGVFLSVPAITAVGILIAKNTVSVDEMITSPKAVTLLVLLIILLVVLSIWTVIQFLLGGAMEIGSCRYNTELIEKKSGRFSLLFAGFDIFGKALALRCLQIILIFLWSLLFVIPGILAAYRFSMAPYILAENPEMHVRDAIRESKRIMHGNKMRLFRLHLSFLGWVVLSVLTLGIGNLFLRPYFYAAGAAFYLEVSGQTYRLNAYGGDSIPDTK